MNIILTTSWDDGDILDLKLSEFLFKKNIKATFYIPTKNKLQNTLSSEHILYLSKAFEIGGHTFNHLDLQKLDYTQAYNEIRNNKLYLEDIVNNEITSFCYPKGKYKTETIKIIKSLNYKYARTVELFKISLNNPFLAPTTFQIKKSDFTIYKNMLKNLNFSELFNYTLFKKYLSKEQTEIIIRKNYNLKNIIIHIWGHSWEIEKYNLWDKLSEILDFMLNYFDIKSCTNGEMLKLIQSID